MARSRTEWMTENRRASSSSVRNLISLRLRLALGFWTGGGGRSSSGSRMSSVRWNEELVEASRHFEYHVMKSYRQGSMKTTLRKEILLNYPLAVRAAGALQFGSGSA